MDLFNNVPESKEILKSLKPLKKELLRGEALFYEDDLCSSIAIIKRGHITAIKHFKDGHETILRTLQAHEIIGLSLIFSSNPFYKATFYADTNTTVTLLSKDELITLMNNYPQIQANILSYISDESIRLNEHIKLLSYKTIRSRFCYYLYTEYLKRKATTFVIEHTKTDLASLINAERPSLSYEISKLCDEGIIANQNKLYTIISIDKILAEL